MNFIPTYSLYGENNSEDAEFLIHCETIASRSEVHQWQIKSHRHSRFLQLLVVSNGLCEYQMDGKAGSFSAGHAVIVPAGVSHGYQFSTDIEGYVVTVVADGGEQLFPDHPRLARWLDQTHIVKFPRGHTDLDFLNISLARFIAEFDSQHLDRALSLNLQLRSLLMLVYRQDSESNGMTNALGQQSDDRLDRLIQLINQHYWEHQPIAFYAANTGLSLTHLNRLCREAYGLPVSGLLARRLTQEAKRNLVFSAKTVQAIGFDLGFSDPGYFSRFFTRHAGITPLSFRRTQRALMET